MEDSEYNVKPFIESFFNSLTPGQFELLRNGTPDSTTKVLLADMILNMVTVLIEALLNNRRTRNMSEVKDVGDTVMQGFKDVLEVKDEIRDQSSEMFSSMINEEVRARVNSNTSETLLPGDITPPTRLNEMVNHALKMIKRFTAKLKFTIRERRQGTTFRDRLVPDLNGTDDESPETSHAVDNHKNVPSGGQTDTGSIQSPEAVIVREVNKTMLPFLDDMSDADFQNLQVDSSLETTVPRGVLEELQESEGTDKKTQGSSVKGFFTLHFSKTWLNRILNQMKRKFRKDSDKECSPVLMKHIEDIFPKLLRLDDDEAQFGKQKRTPPMLKGIPRSKSLVITRTLTNMLFQRMMGSLTFPHSASSSSATMYHEIWSSVWNFTGLLQWWQKTQVAPLAQRMRSALVNSLTPSPVVDHQSSIPLETPAGPAQDNLVHMQRNRNRVETSQTGKMEDSEYSVKPFIESFFNSLTPGQFELLRNGTPDSTTKVLLADMILNMNTVLIEALLNNLRTRNMSEVKDVGDTVMQGFKDVLEVKDEIRDQSSEMFSSMINEEVRARVNSNTSETLLSGDITPPTRLNEMVNHALKMIKRFTAKLKFTIRERRQGTTFRDRLVPDLNGTDDESPETSHAVDNHKNVPSGGQTDTGSIQSPEAVIVREVNKTMLPFLDDMSDADFQILQVDSSLETTVPRGVLEELQESEGTYKKTQGSSVKGFFTLHFSKTWLNRILDQMKRKFRKDSDKECSPVLMKHIEDIIPELLRLDDDEAQFGKQKRTPSMLKGIPRIKSLVIPRKLTNMLFQRMMGSLTFPHSASSSSATMYHEIWSSVCNFTGLLRWWLKTQVAPLAQRMRSALVNSLTPSPVVDHQSSIPLETPAGPAQDNLVHMQRNRNRVETSQTGKMEDSEYSVKPFIESFFNSLTPGQFELLRNGTPDSTTKVLLADMILNMVTVLIEALLNNLRTRNMSEVKDVGDTVMQGFKDVLEVKDEIRDQSSEMFSSMINEEVRARVNSNTSETLLSGDITPPTRLNEMVNHALKMIKRFTAKLKFTIRERRQGTTFRDRLVPDLNGTDDESPETSHAVDNHKNVPSGGQTDTGSIQSPEAVIVREVNKTMLPFLDDMSDADFQNLQVDSSLETTVPRGVLEELQESEGTYKKTQGSSVKGFFTLHFSKTWLNRILDQMKRKFRKDSDKECSPVLMKHIEDIIPELLRLDDDEAQFGKQKRTPSMLKGIPRIKSLVIPRKLTNMLFQRMMGSLTFPHSASSSSATMYHEIWSSVCNFTGLLRWWLKTQVAPLAQRMRSALVNSLTPSPVVDHQSSIPLETPAGPAQDKLVSERVKAEIIMEKLFTKLLENCERCISGSEILVLVQGLVEKIVKRVNLHFDFTEKNVNDLNKTILKKLSKMIGNKEMVLLSLKLGDVAVENCIISAIKDYRTPTERIRSWMSRLFCCMRAN
ncbi:uncharacterized protein LOC144383251 [Gasterosteus aculeatus]